MNYLAKQPNGLYCRFSTVVDCPTHYNMTREDYIQVIMDRGHNRGFAEEEADDIIKNDLQPFERIIQDYTPLNMTRYRFIKILKEMCWDVDYAEFTIT
jgi:hypothetical protein